MNQKRTKSLDAFTMIPHYLVDAMEGNLMKIYLFQYIRGWCDYNDKHSESIKDGYVWFYHTLEELQEKLAPIFTKRTLQRVSSELLKEGWIIRGYYNDTPFDRTSWYRPNYEKIIQIQQEYIKTPMKRDDAKLAPSNIHDLAPSDDAKLAPSDDAKLAPCLIENKIKEKITEKMRERDSLPQPPVAVSGSQAFADHFDKTVYSKAISNLFSNPNVEKLFLKTSPLEFETWLKDRHRDVPIIVLEKKFGELADVIEGEPKKYKNIKGAINTYITFGMKDYLQNERTKSFSRGNERRYENARRVPVEDLPF